MEPAAAGAFGPQRGEGHQTMLDGSRTQFSETDEGTQSEEPRGLTVADIVMSSFFTSYGIPGKLHANIRENLHQESAVLKLFIQNKSLAVYLCRPAQKGISI